MMQLLMEHVPIEYMSVNAPTFSSIAKEKKYIYTIEQQCASYSSRLPAYVSYELYIIPIVKQGFWKTETGIGFFVQSNVTTPIYWTYQNIEACLAEQKFYIKSFPRIRLQVYKNMRFILIFTADCSTKKKYHPVDIPNAYFEMDRPSQEFIDFLYR